MKRRQHFRVGDVVRGNDGQRGVVVHIFDHEPLRDIAVVVRYVGSRDGIAVPSDVLRREDADHGV